jgi:hypothetical protein
MNMDIQIIQAASTVLLVLVIPFAIQAIKTKAMSANASRVVALALSLAAGAIAGFINGIPATPALWVAVIFAMVGGIQTAYAAFKAVGITNKWLDALLEIGNVATAEPAKAVEPAKPTEDAPADHAE